MEAGGWIGGQYGPRFSIRDRTGGRSNPGRCPCCGLLMLGRHADVLSCARWRMSREVPCSLRAQMVRDVELNDKRPTPKSIIRSGAGIALARLALIAFGQKSIGHETPCFGEAIQWLTSRLKP